MENCERIIQYDRNPRPRSNSTFPINHRLENVKNLDFQPRQRSNSHQAPQQDKQSQWQPRSRSNTEFRDVTLNEIDPVSLPNAKKTFISLPEIYFHGHLRRLPKYDLGFENWTFEEATEDGAVHENRKPPRRRPAVNIDDTEYMNDVGQWNMENMIRKEVESIESRRLCTNDVVFGGERYLLLPENFRQYDKELLMKKRYVRRNGVQVYDKKGLVELLTLFISIKCMMMTSL